MRARGFTLMEVMIAAALLAIMGALLATSLNGAITAKEGAEDVSNRYHLIRQAMSRMADEISMAYLSKHVNALEAKSKTGFKGGDDQLYFTAFGHIARVQDAKESEQRELAYAFEIDPRTNTKSIRRREQANPDLELDEGGRWQTLLPGVQEFTLQYYDARAQDWVDSWDTESSATQNRLPARVKIRMEAEVNEAGDTTVFVTETRIFLPLPFKFD